MSTTAAAAQQTGTATLCAIDLPQGTFEVDATGQACYRIPIEVPPGIAGMAPALALTYKHRGPNGLLGVGWDLSGLSAIARTGPTYAQDGFAAPITFGPTDRFSLDGLRLVPTSGSYGGASTVYYTEVQTWQRVQAQDGGFVVKTKDGETRSYGTTTDSRFMTADGQHVLTWALASRQDRFGNAVRYTYTRRPLQADSTRPGQDDGCSYLDRVDYTVRQDLTAQRSVQLTYERRSDVLVTAVGGQPVVTSFRLLNLRTSIPGWSVRQYDLAYGTCYATGASRIATVTERAFGGSPNSVALPPTQLLWQDVTAPGFALGTPLGLPQHPEQVGIYMLDTRGNGCTDPVQIWRDQHGQLHATTYLASGSGFQPGRDSTLGFFGEVYEVLSADVTGNDCTDLLIAYKQGNGQMALAVCRSTVSGFAAPVVYATGDAWLEKHAHIKFFAMDANGDGRTDLVEAYVQQDGLLAFRTYLSCFGDTSDASFQPAIVTTTSDPAMPAGVLGLWAVDVNNDGLVDLVRACQQDDGSVVVTSYISTSTAMNQVRFGGLVRTSLGTLATTNTLAFFPIDVNGDGCTDLLQIWHEERTGGTALHFTAFQSDGAGGFAGAVDSLFPEQLMAPGTFMPMNFYGTGPATVVSRWVAGDGTLMFSTFLGSQACSFRAGSTFSAGVAGALYDEASFFVADLDGNGLGDLVRVDANAQGDNVALVPYRNTGLRPNLLQSITNPLGARITVTYDTLANPAVYSSPPASAYGGVVTLAGGTLPVVSGYTLDSGSGGSFPLTGRHQMAYTNASIALNGRGWQGFASVSNLNLITGEQVTHDFLQGFPFTGMVSAVTTEACGLPGADPRVPSGHTVLMKRASFQLAHSVSNGVELVVQQRMREDHYDYGTFDYAVAKVFNQDTYGNVTLETYLGYVDSQWSPQDPSLVVYRHATYRNDNSADGWSIGLPLVNKTSSSSSTQDLTAFNPAQDFSLVQRTYDDATLALLREDQWDSANQVNLTTSHAYDAYGNRTQTTKPGNIVSRQTYDPTYHTFPTTTQLLVGYGQVVETSHGYDPGLGSEIARKEPNGAIFITALDAFGRVLAKQGPAPGSVHDNNLLGILVTGGSDLENAFRHASMLTTELYTYDVNNGSARACTQKLQSFPTDATRSFLSAWRYVDGLGRTRRETLESGQQAGLITVEIQLDSEGRVTSRSTPCFAGQVGVSNLLTSYDVLGRPVWHQQTTGEPDQTPLTTTWSYQAGGRVTKTTAVGTPQALAQHLVQRVYDGDVRTTSSGPSADGTGATTFTYNALGKPLTSVDPMGVTNTIALDSLERRSWFDCPDLNPNPNGGSQKALTYAYDPASGLLTTSTDAAGQPTRYLYDDAGRLVTQQLPDGRAVGYIYDTPLANAQGRIATISVLDAQGLPESSRAYVYDLYGHVVQETLTVAWQQTPYVTTSTYDPVGRMVGQTLPDGTPWQRTYQSGKLVSESLGAASVSFDLQGYTPFGRSGLMQAGPLTSTWSYNPLGQLMGETLTSAGVTVMQQSYGRDVLGQITAISDLAGATAGQIQRYTYDRRRLVSATVPDIGSVAETYGYDAAGNMTSKEGVSFTYEHHFPVAGATGEVPRYNAVQDACGRTQSRTLDGSTTLYSYDGLGALSGVRNAAGGSITTITNDHRGDCLRRQCSDGTDTLYVGPNYVVTNGQPTKYLRDERGVVATIDQNGVRYLRRDHLGSITHIFDSAGTLLTRLAYSAYGSCKVMQGSAGAQLRYEQRPWDEGAALYDFKSRPYDPYTGRFLTPDTRLGAAHPLQADVFNRFAMELNNPLNHVDPSGHSVSAGLAIGLSIGLLLAGAAVLIAGAVLLPAAAPLVAAAGTAVAAAWAGTATVGAAATAVGTAVLAVGASATVAAIGGGLVLGGIAGLVYASSNYDNFKWSDYAAVVGISAAIGGFSAGLGEVVSAVVPWSLVVIPVVGVITAASDTLTTLSVNAATGIPLDTGLASAAILGFAFGVTARSFDRILEAGIEKAATAVRNASVAVENRAINSLHANILNIVADGNNVPARVAAAATEARDMVHLQRGLMNGGLKLFESTKPLPDVLVPIPQVYAEAHIIFGAKERPEPEEAAEPSAERV